MLCQEWQSRRQFCDFILKSLLDRLFKFYINKQQILIYQVLIINIISFLVLYNISQFGFNKYKFY